MTSETARRIVDCGALAPSGDNLQPWLVRWRGGVLHVAVDPARDKTIYNFQYRASLIAIGAMLENMTIAARESGLAANVETLGSAGEGLPSFALTFTPARLTPDPLYTAIARRCTNRRPYATSAVPASLLEALRSSVAGSPATELVFVEDRGAMRAIAWAASLNDRLLFEVRQLHDQFFETIRWTRAEAEASRDGILIDSLELGPMRAGFRAMRSWTLVRLANALGSSRMAPRHSYRTFLRSGAFGFLQMPSNSPEAFVEGGRLLQRLWLTATSTGLAFQPMAGMLYLLWSLGDGDRPPWVASKGALLARAAAEFGHWLPLAEGKGAIMLFRIGLGDPPSATSLRRPLPAASER